MSEITAGRTATVQRPLPFGRPVQIPPVDATPLLKFSFSDRGDVIALADDACFIFALVRLLVFWSLLYWACGTCSCVVLGLQFWLLRLVA